MTSTPRTATAGGGLPHGGRLNQAARLFREAPRPFLDLSTGINPVPYPLPSLDPPLFTRLPEPEDVAALEAAAARAYGAADPALVVAAPGTQILISMIPRLVPSATVAVLAPTYGEHAQAWASAGHEVVEVESLADLPSVASAVLCNPNNPDGRRVPPAALAALAGRLAGRGGLLIVDEAFADLEAPPLSVVGTLPCAGLVVLRSFGKTYGLAGLRLGFALTDPAFGATLRAALGPWAVSGPAIAIARRALGDEGWRADAAARLAADGARLDAAMERAGLRPVGGTRLFRLGQGGRAPLLFDQLGRAGILVRRFDYRPDWLRFGLPATEEGWARLEAALR